MNKLVISTHTMNAIHDPKKLSPYFTLRVRGMVLIALASILLLSCIFYVLKHIHLYHQMKEQPLVHIPYKEDNFFLGIAHFFFDKIGILSFLLDYLFFAYGRYYVQRRKKIRTLRRLSLLLLFWIVYGNILLGFLFPRYIFPYSGSLGKKIAVSLIRHIGFGPTFLLILLLIPLLSRFLWIRIKKKSTSIKHN